MTPVFIFSLPRSGSTLLQRIIAAHEQVSTAAEPWFLLPFFYARRENGISTEYNQLLSAKALQDFFDRLPAGDKDYQITLRSFALQLYQQAAGKEATHFVDKTPRYSLIANEVIQTFPDAKFIFLWRNPLAVTASILKTFGVSEQWNLHRYKVDLYKGLGNLLETYQSTDKGYALKYEDLVLEPERMISQLFSYLNLPHDPNAVSDFSRVSLSGRMGDPTGVHKYDQISTSTLKKWRNSFCNPLRHHWAKGYLRWINRDRLLTMGYSLDGLLAELSEVPYGMKYFISDLFYRGWGTARTLCDPSVQKRKLRALPEWKYVIENV